jgi:hypothetical protein
LFSLAKNNELNLRQTKAEKNYWKEHLKLKRRKITSFQYSGLFSIVWLLSIKGVPTWTPQGSLAL